MSHTFPSLQRLSVLSPFPKLVHIFGEKKEQQEEKKKNLKGQETIFRKDPHHWALNTSNAECQQGWGAGAVPYCPVPSSGTRAYLTHLFVEVLLQASDTLKRVDVESHAAARGGGGLVSRCPGRAQESRGAHPTTDAGLRGGQALRTAWWSGPGDARRLHLFHSEGSSSCRSTFISSNTFCALTSSSSAWGKW